MMDSANPCKIRASASENYSEIAILKLTNVCIEYADLLKLKDLARDIIGDDYVC